MSPKADLLPFEEALDRMYVTAGEASFKSQTFDSYFLSPEGLENHNELVQEELWKLIELDSENERTGVENEEELQGHSIRENQQWPASLLTKREKLFQLLQKLPSRKKRKVMRCIKRGSGKSSEPCGSKNTQKPSLGREMRRFADLFEFHRKLQRVKPKQQKGTKRPTSSNSSSSARERGARKATPGKNSPSVPQKVKKLGSFQYFSIGQVRRVVGAASDTMRALLDLADPLPSVVSFTLFILFLILFTLFILLLISSLGSQLSTILYFFVSGMGNIDDQHRNPNMNNKDHIVGQLTRPDHAVPNHPAEAST